FHVEGFDLALPALKKEQDARRGPTAALAAGPLGRFEQLRQAQPERTEGAEPQEFPAAEAVTQAGQAGAEADHRGPLNASVAAIIRVWEVHGLGEVWWV